MKSMLLALLTAAVLPVAAQNAALRADRQDAAPARAQVKEDKARVDAGATDKERARLAKAKNKEKKKQVAKRKPEKEKKQTPAG